MRYLQATGLRVQAKDALRHSVPFPRSLRKLHGAVLESVARGDKLTDIMDLLCRLMEKRAPWAVCSVLAVEEGRFLRSLAAPSLPGAFSSGIEGTEIGQGVGTCGTAAFLGTQIVTTDIDADPAWNPYKEPVLAAGLRACWSSPIEGRDGAIIGTFALYFRERRGPQPGERRVVSACVDICRLAIEHDALIRQLRQTNERLEVALGNMSQGVCFFDARQRLIVANQQYCQLYDLSPSMVSPGISLNQIVAMRVAAGTGPKMRTQRYMDWRASVHSSPTATDTIVELDNRRTIAIHHQPMPDGGWVATHEDVTERRRADAQITHMARHDALTGLPNRLTFAERMDRALAYAVRGQGCALLCLDLDHFKTVNDTLGHPAGDVLLRSVAERLLNCVREVDTVTRLGGDEFAVLLVGLDGPDRAAEVAERIVRAFGPPFAIDGQSLLASASIGIAVALQDGTTAAQLLKSADTAMYRAKTDTRGGYRFFEPEMDARRQIRVALERDLREAIAAGGLTLAYQPLLDAATREITGFEALLRWSHPQRGMVPPADFIPIAEETGLIVELGAWVLRQACLEAASWPRPVKVSVNVAASQFKQSAVLTAVHEALAESGLAPDRLELEVTEALLFKSGASVIEVLHALRGTGVGIVLDNFGAGPSSLNHLRGFPFARIKIDRSFTRELSNTPGTLAIIHAIVGLGRSLAMTTTAEGVETEAELTHLREQGCLEVQGFLFSHAVSGDAARAMLAGTTG